MLRAAIEHLSMAHMIDSHRHGVPMDTSLVDPRFYSFTSWGGNSYTLNTDIYLSVSAAINAFLLAGMVAWVVNSARALAVSDKAYFDREDLNRPASSDIIEQHDYLETVNDHESQLDFSQSENYRRDTGTHSARYHHDEHRNSVEARPDTVDDILGYISRSKNEALSVDNNGAAPASYQPQHSGYANYAQYLAAVYGYRTGEPPETSYKRDQSISSNSHDSGDAHDSQGIFEPDHRQYGLSSHEFEHHWDQ